MRPVPDGPTTAAIVAGGTVSATSWKIGPRLLCSDSDVTSTAGGTSFDRFGFRPAAGLFGCGLVPAMGRRQLARVGEHRSTWRARRARIRLAGGITLGGGIALRRPRTAAGLCPLVAGLLRPLVAGLL